MCGSESQKRSGGQSQGRGWKMEDCKEEEVGVHSTTLGQDARGRGHPIGGGQRIPGHGIQMQGGCHQRWEGATALQED